MAKRARSSSLRNSLSRMMGHLFPSHDQIVAKKHTNHKTTKYTPPEPQDDNHLSTIELEKKLEELKTTAILINSHMLEIEIATTEGEEHSIYDPAVYDVNKEQTEHDKRIQSIVDDLNNEQTYKITITVFNIILDPEVRKIIKNDVTNPKALAEITKLEEEQEQQIQEFLQEIEDAPTDEDIEKIYPKFDRIESYYVRQSIIERTPYPPIEEDLNKREELSRKLITDTTKQINGKEESDRNFGKIIFSGLTIPHIRESILVGIKNPSTKQKLTKTHEDLKNQEALVTTRCPRKEEATLTR